MTSGRAAKDALPDLMADHRDWRRTSPIIGRLQRPSDLGIDPQHGEVLAADELPPCRLGMAVRGKCLSEEPPCRNVFEYPLLKFQVLVIRPRERDRGKTPAPWGVIDIHNRLKPAGGANTARMTE
jgi:hypothetical protein